MVLKLDPLALNTAFEPTFLAMLGKAPFLPPLAVSFALPLVDSYCCDLSCFCSSLMSIEYCFDLGAYCIQLRISKVSLY